MNHHYNDITGRIPERPRWWDENAVPRYCDFSPDETANIYARQVALVEIACQSCGALFLVAFSQSYAFDMRSGKKVPTLAEQAKAGTLHYGDPPNYGCCASGPTMNSDPQRVVEFWQKDDRFEWQRVPELEVPLVAPWGRPILPAARAGEIER